MKKLLLFVVVAFSCVLSAQEIEPLLDGAAFSKASSNGVYLVANMDDAAAYYNSVEKNIVALEGEVEDDGGCFVWDLNDKGQLAVDWKKVAAIWTEEKEFDLLPMPTGLTEEEKVFSAARCISNDGKYVVVSFGSPTISIYLYTQDGKGGYTMDKLTLPEMAPIYNQTAQFIWPCGITDDGNRILGRFLVETGEFELPFVWERTPGGDWAIRWIADEFIVEGGKTDAVFYGTGFEFDGDPLEDPEGYEKAENEWLQKREEYYAVIDAVSSGYFFAGEKGNLADLGMSANGKYAKMNISFKDLKSEDTTVYNYPAAIDLETEKVYVFSKLDDAGCLSITNEGFVSMATPRVSYIRSTYVASIKDPQNVKSLTDWTKEKTANAIDLAEYMVYSDMSGQSFVADGAAVLFDNGTGFFTCQYKDTEEESVYETYIVRFAEGVATEIVNDDNFVVYPNPTSGVLNFTETLENVEVFDLLGRKVYTVSVAEKMVNLNNLVSGTYFLVADKQGERISVKFVVK